jgi:hypothetical protein
MVGRTMFPAVNPGGDITMANICDATIQRVLRNIHMLIKLFTFNLNMCRYTVITAFTSLKFLKSNLGPSLSVLVRPRRTNWDRCRLKDDPLRTGEMGISESAWQKAIHGNRCEKVSRYGAPLPPILSTKLMNGPHLRYLQALAKTWQGDVARRRGKVTWNDDVGTNVAR